MSPEAGRDRRKSWKSLEKESWEEIEQGEIAVF